MDFPSSPELSAATWFLGALATFVAGISKAGIKGIAIIIVTLMALAFGARQSTGLLVPILVAGDIFAVLFYNRHTQWSYIARFLPWMILGLLIGVFVGQGLAGEMFEFLMVCVILLSVLLMYWWDQRKSKSVPSHWLFAGCVGVMAGFTTMIGNLAGAFTNIYFLAMRLPKNQFIGTAAWLFLIINVLKLPFHIFIWKTINPASLWIDLHLLPVIFLGLYAGVRLVKYIREVFYRRLILLLTALGAILMLLR